MGCLPHSVWSSGYENYQIVEISVANHIPDNDHNVIWMDMGHPSQILTTAYQAK